MNFCPGCEKLIREDGTCVCCDGPEIESVVWYSGSIVIVGLTDEEAAELAIRETGCVPPEET